MKFGMIAPQVNLHRLMIHMFDMNSYFQDGGRDIISQKCLIRLCWTGTGHAQPPHASGVIGQLYTMPPT